MSGSVQLIFKTIIWVLMIALFLTAFFFAVTFAQAISFKSYVGGQINREGGLTPTAMANIDDYSANNYQGKFTVVSESGNDKKAFGETVEYTIKTTYNMGLAEVPVPISMPGNASSKIR